MSTLEVLLSAAAQIALPRVQAIIFDIDGVLIETSRSIRAVNCLVVPDYLRRLPGWSASNTLLTSHDIEQFKTAGGFNDDWDLTCALVLLFLYKAARYGNKNADTLLTLAPTIAAFTQEIARRGGWLHAAEVIIFALATPAEAQQIGAFYHRPLIRRLFQELWAGDKCRDLYGFAPVYHAGAGYVRFDTSLFTLPVLDPRFVCAVLTGRTQAEAHLALMMVGIADTIAPVHRMTATDGNQKPDPGGLVRLLKTLDVHTALYIGDSVDDLRTVLNYRGQSAANAPQVLSAQVLSGTTGEAARDLFAQADIIAPNVNAVLRTVYGAV